MIVDDEFNSMSLFGMNGLAVRQVFTVKTSHTQSEKNVANVMHMQGFIINSCAKLNFQSNFSNQRSVLKPY